MMRAVADVKWSIIGAAVVGVLVAPVGGSWWRSALEAYDTVRPVVVMAGTLVERDSDSVLLRVSGEKLRSCTYIRVQAFGRQPGGQLDHAYARRVDTPEDGATKPLGNFNIGVWRVWPVTGALAVVMYAQHDCSGRIVLTKIAEVAL